MRFVSTLLAQTWAERRARRTRRVAGRELRRAAHVEHLQVFPRFEHPPQLGDRHLLDLRDLKAGLAPRRDAAAQIAAHRVVADARQTRHGLVHLRLVRGDEDDGPAQRDERAGPARELTAQPDVERAGDVPRAEL